MDDLDQPDRIKKMMTEEFEHVINMLNMNWYGHDIFRRWYVDGRLYYHKIIDERIPKMVCLSYDQLILQRSVKFAN